ncbi:hypothetical protein AUEXF2481DRAFT_37011 [Aureobasidium subglaciale EXF-2481]|uniref:Zn(2)-C6 fungal-type domain-containing protein n=1 Tax=Aureobasidium subglaciale (strain EXF-2481) TaxID=1043005 RepID=A0A074YL03_AURSE|nr:uncharacterized protein AUEXF2481DRAFT_37011 [Aureobasidium subglaciale EXF-2481]KAI5211955.1 hypothetical protein E4T38_00865 [Aureobasidium subglaciale]KAI5230802.1 hypothetical protein E4T40_00866 [Aureobasidium subglaciale]KAI5233825.1 hypothetical protein E4T41_00864 [Aureobasidium subglaciale]KAI5267204.1 hypothetical protein E4T46_00864 [Aureobasidium subglaciale]KEQ98498.1 hypothetical protein AUEXF2481DRAFT_37011 [Aureobasidium subglaciale EXF-2481]
MNNSINSSNKKKRANPQASDGTDEAVEGAPGEGAAVATNGASTSASSSNFRNVSACNRCRLRKNRCDQKLPACTSCEKANVKCVGFDPVSKREIPRSYVYYLESRVQHLESLLQANEILYAPTDDFSMSVTTPPSPNVASMGETTVAGAQNDRSNAGPISAVSNEQTEQKHLSNLVHNIGMVSVQGASDARYLGSTSGISFARVVFAAVKSSVSGSTSERGGVRPSKPLTSGAATGGTTMRDSFFGLQTKPAIKPATFPDKDIGQRLMELYFEHSNPQIPVLHRGEFMALFDRVYATDEKKRTPRELYMLNIVFATGAGVILEASDKNNDGENAPDSKTGQSRKRQKLSHEQSRPEEYHASAIVHLESFLGSSSSSTDGIGGGLEELQAVLLLAGFALLRPVAPGLWYIVGVAMRLAVDLGLHNEDPEASAETGEDQGQTEMTAAAREEYGRRQYIRDYRRRLWWCVYSFDRLVSTCVGRPFGITDQVITTEFPTLLDDKYITPNGFLTPPQNEYGSIPSYKHVSYHYFRLRLLQSEVLQVLQHRQTQQFRERGTVHGANRWMHTDLPSPFLSRYSSFREWRGDIDRRLYEWIESSPTQTMTGVAFSPLFLELNYWLTVTMLYRQSLSVPPSLAGELDATTGDDVTSPGHVDYEEEDEEMVFLKVAEAGQKTLKIYRQLHRVRLVNHTFLATHHLFMSGISFLYAIWHSTVVRSKLTLDDVDFTILAATSVLGDMIEKCPPAEACRDAFDRMSKATIAMVEQTTGFGSQALRYIAQAQKVQQHAEAAAASEHIIRKPNPASVVATGNQGRSQQHQQPQQARRPMPRFDMNLRDLFTDDESTNRPSAQRRGPFPAMARPQNAAIKREGGAGFPGTPTGPSYQQNQISPQLYAPSPPVDSSLQATPPPLARQSPSQHHYYPRGGQNYLASGPQGVPGQLEGFEFLQDFQVPDQGGLLGQAGQAPGGYGEFDMGFGAGGLAFDGGGQPWDEHGGFDLFDGFFFGGTNGGGQR